MTTQYFSRSSAIIAASADVTNEIICLASPAIIYIPAGFQTCDLTYLVASAQGGTYAPLKSITGDTVITAGVTAGDPVSLEPSIFDGVQFLKIKCSVTQSAAREILVVFTPLFGKYVT
jgi:hypothetical protein